MSHFERLSALDNLFLGIESESLHMHVGALMVFEPGSLVGENGGVDFDRLCAYVDAQLRRMPRYRQRLKRVPGLGHPVWVDDEHFQIRFHLRHTALPKPGDRRALQRLAGRIFSQKLDRSRPLWEMWVVEGLAEGGFALIPKVHHAMVDGVAGMDVMAALLRGTPDEGLYVPRAQPDWSPQPAPKRGELIRSELSHRVRGLRGIFSRGREALREMSHAGSHAREQASGIGRLITKGLAPAPATSINPREVSPYRRFDVCRLPLAQAKEIKNALGGKVNDVIMAVTAGALHKYLAQRGDDPRALSGFRALMPVNIRKPSHQGSSGNRVALGFVDLPVSMEDPSERYQAVLDATSRVKGDSQQIEGAALLEELADVTSDAVMREAVRAAGALRVYNTVITNVPGPPFPLYLLGAQMREVYPLVPLFYQQTVGLAILSYSGELFWGLCGDWHATPDLHELSRALRESFDELVELASEAAKKRSVG